MKRLTKKANTLKRIMAILLAIVMMNTFTVALADYSEPCDVCGELEDSCVCDPTAQAEQCPICGIALVDAACPDCDPASAGNIEPNPDFDIADHLIVNAYGSITGFVALGAPSDITIPVYSKNGLTITSIGTNAFTATGLTSVSFESGSQISTIGANAFQNNPITAVTNLPATLKTISTYAFAGTQITTINLPDGVTDIGNFAFYNCKQLESVDLSCLAMTSLSNSVFYGCNVLSSLTLPAALKTIGVNVVYNCHELGYIKIPASVTAINSAAFASIKNGATIDLSDHSPYSIGGSPWGASNAAIIWQDSAIDGDFVFDAASGLILGLSPAYAGDGNIEIPAEIDGAAVRGFAVGAFKNSALIRNVTFAADSQITEIAAETFQQCSNLTSIVLPEGITAIGSYAFSNTKLSAIDLPESLTKIGGYAFQRTQLTDIIIPEGITAIGEYTFFECRQFASVTLPESLTSIGQFAFQSTKLMQVTIPKNVRTIASQAFYSISSLTDVIFEGSAINGIAATTFSVNTKNIYLTHKNKDSLSGSPWAANYAIIHWADATDAPAIVTDDSGMWEFSTASGAISKYLGPVGADVDIVVPASLSYGGADYLITEIGVNNQKIMIGGINHIGQLTIANGITRINQTAFYQTYIGELDLGSTVTNIASSAFSSGRLNSLTLPESLTSIGSNAFYGTGLSGEIIIPKGVTSILSASFGSNPGITQFVVHQYRNKASDSEYNKINTTTLNSAPWGAAAGTPVFFMDDPRPVYEYEVIANAATGTVAIELKTRINLGLNVGAITAAAGMPALTNVSLAPSGNNWSTARMTVSENGTYSFVVTFLGTEKYTIDVTVDDFRDLTYVPNGGTGTAYTAAVLNPAKVAASSFTAPEGYEFAAWNTKADGSGKDYAPGAALAITADTTLYARWEELPHANDCDCDECNPAHEDDCDCDDCNPEHSDDCDCDDCNDCKDCDCDADCAGDCDCDECEAADGSNGNNGNNDSKENGDVNKKSDDKDNDNANDNDGDGAANSDGQDQNKDQSQDDTDSLLTDAEDGTGSQISSQPAAEANTAGTGTTSEPTAEPSTEQTTAPTTNPTLEQPPEPTPERPMSDDGFVGGGDEYMNGNNSDTPLANIGERQANNNGLSSRSILAMVNIAALLILLALLFLFVVWKRRDEEEEEEIAEIKEGEDY
ncbi:MAG: leucine-rich repeat protein [Oscillospiraceae bacterium]|nr:leucine-rich repeat protein [Oscillospiraceae bacterium]